MEGDSIFSEVPGADNGIWASTAELTDEIRAELGTPTAWRILVMPKPPKLRSARGILLPSISIDAQAVNNYVGQIVALGPIAFMNPKLGYYDKDGQLVDTSIEPPRVGDWVTYGRYSGQKRTYKGVALLLMNDDEVLEVLPEGVDLEKFKIYVE